jgi:hypothetical protein
MSVIATKAQYSLDIFKLRSPIQLGSGAAIPNFISFRIFYLLYDAHASGRGHIGPFHQPFDRCAAPSEAHSLAPAHAQPRFFTAFPQRPVFVRDLGRKILER